ncbi:hypothetical protein I3842_06G019500 [Carya illinoinensis]|uniref:Uncharacterized protein n=1 Tax=Carya illinoinensis TaxID=32201 RepID=A0A922ESL9_CARIL|nr:hypothetical protein I3842_06G019500 [Carya illinoinensis]
MANDLLKGTIDMHCSMDLHLLSSLPTYNFTRYPFQCKAINEISSQPNIVRRSANYQPPIWHYDYIQSLRREYEGDTCTRQVHKMKGEVMRRMLLGLSYHFEDEIEKILESIYSANHGGDHMCKNEKKNGHNVSQDIFNTFKNEKGNFKTCLCDDTKGLLCLYEASFLLIEGETILEEARDKDEKLSAKVSHALELPLHWRMPRLETKWFIDVYRDKEGMNPLLLEFAELDFNMVQAAHQEDLKQASRWWKSTGMGEKFTFARDRLMENFLWTVGMAVSLNGTQMQWMDSIPYYMKIYFLVLHNSTNEMAFDALKEQGLDIIGCLKKVLVDLCRSFLLEAKCLQEYLKNAWISIAAPVALVHAYIFVTNPMTEEALDCLEEYSNIICWSSMILRLADDLGTSKDELKRGDVSKSIQCYMKETGASEEDAREYISPLISATWKRMNEERISNSPFSKMYLEVVMNLARMAQCTYQHGDGHGVQDCDNKDHVLSLLIHPIPLNRDQIKNVTIFKETKYE